jgi:hypothetical protein
VKNSDIQPSAGTEIARTDAANSSDGNVPSAFGADLAPTETPESELSPSTLTQKKLDAIAFDRLTP